MSRASPLPRSGERAKAVMVGVIGRLPVIASPHLWKPWQRRLSSAWVILLALFEATTNQPLPIRRAPEAKLKIRRAGARTRAPLFAALPAVALLQAPGEKHLE